MFLIRTFNLLRLVYRKIYRFSELGSSLTNVVNDLQKEGKISEEQKESILVEFDKVNLEGSLIDVENGTRV